MTRKIGPRPMIDKPPPLLRDHNRDSNKKEGVINQGSTLHQGLTIILALFRPQVELAAFGSAAILLYLNW